MLTPRDAKALTNKAKASYEEEQARAREKQRKLEQLEENLDKIYIKFVDQLFQAAAKGAFFVEDNISDIHPLIMERLMNDGFALTSLVGEIEKLKSGYKKYWHSLIIIPRAEPSESQRAHLARALSGWIGSSASLTSGFVLGVTETDSLAEAAVQKIARRQLSQLLALQDENALTLGGFVLKAGLNLDGLPTFPENFLLNNSPCHFRGKFFQKVRDLIDDLGIQRAFLREQQESEHREDELEIARNFDILREQFQSARNKLKRDSKIIFWGQRYSLRERLRDQMMVLSCRAGQEILQRIEKEIASAACQMKSYAFVRTRALKNYYLYSENSEFAKGTIAGYLREIGYQVYPEGYFSTDEKFKISW